MVLWKATNKCVREGICVSMCHTRKACMVSEQLDDMTLISLHEKQKLIISRFLAMRMLVAGPRALDPWNNKSGLILIPTIPLLLWKRENSKVTNNIFKADAQLIFGSFQSSRGQRRPACNIYFVSDASRQLPCSAWSKVGENKSSTLHTGHWESASLHLTLREAKPDLILC